jgi:hypothetical protein
MMTDFKKIFLQPECCVEDQDVGRMWCQDAINDCEEGNEWIEYTLSSDVNQRISELEKERDLMLYEVANQYDGNDLNEMWSIGANHVFKLFAKWVFDKRAKALKEQDNG